PSDEELKKNLETGSEEYIASELMKVFSLSDVHKNWNALITTVKEKTRHSITFPDEAKLDEINTFWDRLPFTHAGFLHWIKAFFDSDQEKHVLAAKTEGAYRYYFAFLDPLLH